MRPEEDIKRRAQELGFSAVGVGSAEPLLEHERYLVERLAAGGLAGLDYFRAERVPLATWPRLLLPAARGVISLAWAYDGSQPAPPAAGGYGRVAAYARGRDYHSVVKEKLCCLVAFVQERLPGTTCRAFVDATPLLERALAARAGLGWFGKNNCLLTPANGSWVLLAEVLTSAELAPDAPLAGDCGSCRACLDACPTGALAAPYSHRASRCLSFVTVELRGPIPVELRPLLGDRLLGCDVCQAACPRNTTLPLLEGAQGRAVLNGGGASPTARPSLAGLKTQSRLKPAGSDPSPLQRALCLQPGGLSPGRRPRDLSPLSPETENEPGLPPWLELAPLFSMDEEAFRARFAGTAAFRTKRRGLLRNAAVVLGNSGDRDCLPVLARALADPEPLVRGHAAWALGRLGGRAPRAALEAAAVSEPRPEVGEEIAAALAAC